MNYTEQNSGSAISENEKSTQNENGQLEGAVIKLSPSDLELNESDDDGDDELLSDSSIYIKEESEPSDDDGNSGSVRSENDDISQFCNGWSKDGKHKEGGEKEDEAGTKRNMGDTSSSSSKRGRGRPKQPRTMNDKGVDGGTSESQSEEEVGTEIKPVLRPGSGYPVEFKMKVLRYADTHSNSATAEKFGLKAKRVREWRMTKQKIEEDYKGGLQRRPRSDGFTVEQKLQAVKLATERSIEEARLFYNVDRCTIGKWKRKKTEFEARLLRGEAKAVRQTGAGRKPKLNSKIEERLRDWVVAQRKQDVSVTHKMIITKAISLMDEDPTLRDVPRPRTWSWVTGFLKRQNLQGLDGSASNFEEAKELSNLAPVGKHDDLDQSTVNQDVQGDGTGGNLSVDDDYNSSSSWKGSSDEEESFKDPTLKTKEETKKKTTKRKMTLSPKPKRQRGRPKLPRRINIPDDYTSDEDEGNDKKPALKPGSGYPVEFKLRVLKYAETHSSTATAEKFGLQPVRVRDWKRAKYKIEEESKGSLKRRPRSDGFTVEEKLQAVAFATERSIDEARLLYNVDRNTIGKWKAKKDQLEARLLRGEGSFIRELGSGRKPKYTQIENSLRDWIVALRLKGVTLNYKMVLNKAKSLIEEDPNMRGLPVPRTWSWVTGFLKRQNIHGMLGNTLGHEDPRELLHSDTTEINNGKQLAEKIVDIPENPNKRNRRTITLEDKVNIIRRIEQGETQGTVAKSLNVATSTIQTIWSCRSEIVHKYLNPKAKSKSDALLWKTYSSIGAALEDWVEQTVSKTTKITSTALMEKAIQLSETYRLPQFSGEAKSWLRIFCKRFKLFDLLTEIKDGNVEAHIAMSSHTSSAGNYQNLNMAINSPDSSNHHDDDFQSDHKFNDFVPSKHNEPQTQSLQSNVRLGSDSASQSSHHNNVQSHHHAFPINPVSDHQRFSTSTYGSNTHKQGVITTADAMKCYRLLRHWIQDNYGQHENILSSKLSGVENTVLKGQVTETGYYT